MKTSLTHRAAIALFAVVIGLAMAVPDAEARRLGGGRSFGKQSGNVMQRQAPAQPNAPAQKQNEANPSQAQQPPGAAPVPARNRWLGPIAGIAAGLGIAALLSHFGLGGAFADMLGSFLLIGGLVIAGLLVYRWLKGGGRASALARPAPASPVASPQAWSAVRPEQPLAREGASARGTVSVTGEPLRPIGSAVDARVSGTPTWTVPADFDVAAFVRSAKVYFVRLQAAWDAGDQADIREFTTPEMFAEIKTDLAERGSSPNQTDVIDLEAEFLGIEEVGRHALASVRFHGQLREAPGEAPTSFSEVWNLTKPLSGKQGWLLAGIQQLESEPA